MFKKFYLTKQESADYWHYVGYPTKATTTMDAGLIKIVDKSEIRVDDLGTYVIREIQ